MLEKYAYIRVAKEILGNPTHRYSVRETAKKAGVSVFAAKQVLDYLFKKQMICLEKVGKTYQYYANLDNYLTRQWKVIFSLEELQKAAIVKKIMAQSRQIFSIVLYGSVAIGRDDKSSDIDILVVSDLDQATKKKILAQAVGMDRETNISVYTPMEWRKNAGSNKAFYENVLYDSISLYGEKPVIA